MAYTYGQLETLWIDAGGSKVLAPLMAAIALAESGGNPQATNPTDNGGTQTSWGLWQISDGTHNQPVNGILNPATNAKAAVAKYQQQGLGAWGTYTSGAYRQYYQGSTAPSSLPQGGSGGGGGGGSSSQDATLTAFGPGSINWLGGPEGIIQSAAGAVSNLLFSGVTGGVSTASGIEGVWKSLSAIAADFNAMMKSVEWLFKPGNWIRMICFGNGVVLGLLGLRSLSKASEGSAQVATGIVLVTLSGVFLFLAFHNLPDDVQNLQGLLGYISQGIRFKAGQDTTQPAGVSGPT